jgi:hypothetical protein
MQDIDQDEMRAELRQLYATEPEARLLQVMGRSFADPVKPESANGRFRPDPLLVVLGVIASFVVSVFLYFTYFQA